MSLKFWKWHLLRAPLVRRVVLRALMFVLAVIVVSLMQMGQEARLIGPLLSDVDDCSFDSGSNLTDSVFKVLMEKNLLQSNARALCVGQNSANAVLALRHLGFFNVFGVDKHPNFSLLKRRFEFGLDFEDNYFDFVFVEDLDRASARSLLILEIERVLRPGGAGTVLTSPTSAGELFQSSDVVHECHVGSCTKVVVFKKKLDSFASFEQFRLPSACPALLQNRPFMRYLEPLSRSGMGSQFNLQPSYLPKFMNISSRNRLIYINLGAGEYANANIAEMTKPYCSNHHASFEVFIIDHKILPYYVTDPGINFIYHPGLSGDTSPPDITSDEFLSAPMDNEGFDFVRWFKETVSEGDFVVLMMNAKLVELNILVELFKTGAICHVDELFLRCSCDCVNLLEGLRKSGVYAHRWSGDRV